MVGIKNSLLGRSNTNSTSLISLYVPENKKVDDLSRMLNSEISKSSNIKSKQTREDTCQALKSVLFAVKDYKKIPENGLIVFSGNTEEGNVLEIIEPKNKLNQFFYRCDKKFCV